MSNIKLAIRLRPFSERELKSEKDCTPVVNVIDDHTVTITNIKVSASGAGDSRERVRRYLADYTFDSSHEAAGTRHATQDKVFNTMGQDVLACVTAGKSACVLAYGQSATGKTHTMMGSPGQPGLVPRLCNALAQQSCDITVSFLEIYNERVHDLLVGEERVSEYASLPRRRGNTRKDLRVREHPSRGPYVQNLRRVLVHDAESLQALVAEGALRRRTAATKRNATSSRSHALLELATPYATLNLADLAGSEKASWEGCGGGRQKEGANINKSLVALSNVISALVNCGGAGGRGRFVPYRDSALTWLLKDCFTGGAAAFIIATVSPSVACYGESASTLRWASRARLLRTTAPTRNSSSLTTRSALQSQLHQLLAELAKHYIKYIPETGKIIYEENHYTLHTCKENCTEMYAKNLEVTKQLKTRSNELHNSESTASSVASGSSEHIATTNKQRNISDDVDKLFGPALERTSSSNDLKIVAPLRNKRRQYRSQEVLSLDNKNVQPAVRNRKVSLQDIVNNTDTRKSDESIKESDEKQSSPRIPITYDNNQRAEIVASVTERLYSKLKKTEESAIAKVEQVVDKKIVEPLSELKICANARQRLVDLSQKALRNRRKIGIPAHTQTRFRITRVRDQGIDVQTDLEPYYIKERNLYTACQDVSTETVPCTPRCKETSSGPQWGSLYYQDSSTITDKKTISQKTCSVMTDKCVQCDQCTQTKVVPPPRKKKLAPYYRQSSENSSMEFTPPIISINITQGYSTEQDSTSASDDSLENEMNKPKVVTTTPDLLTNHSSGEGKEVEPNLKIKSSVVNDSKDCAQTDDSVKLQANTEGIFSDGEEYNLPRITIDSTAANNYKNIKDMILGHNENTYPYNVILSPPRIKTQSLKRTVKFKDIEKPLQVTSVASQTAWEVDNKLFNITKNQSSEAVSDLDNNSSMSASTPTYTSDAGTISQETKNFIWKTGQIKPKEDEMNSSKSFYLDRKEVYEPVYKVNTPRYKNAKAKIYQEFLGLRPDTNRTRYTSSSSDERQKRDNRNTIYEGDEDEILDFRKKCDFFESKGQSIFNQTRDPFYDFEKKLLRSCDSLDASISQYDNYLKGYQQRMKQKLSPKRYSVISTEPLRHIKPTEYLQHLVQLRKDAVKREISCGDLSSGSVF